VLALLTLLLQEGPRWSGEGPGPLLFQLSWMDGCGMQM